MTGQAAPPTHDLRVVEIQDHLTRIRIAPDGTRTEEPLGHSTFTGSKNVRFTFGYGSARLGRGAKAQSTPRINADTSIDLRLAITPWEYSITDRHTFIHESQLPALRQLHPDDTIHYGTVAETDDRAVLDALRHEQPLPTISKAYSVIVMTISAHILVPPAKPKHNRAVAVPSR